MPVAPFPDRSTLAARRSDDAALARWRAQLATLPGVGVVAMLTDDQVLELLAAAPRLQAPPATLPLLPLLTAAAAAAPAAPPPPAAAPRSAPVSEAPPASDDTFDTPLDVAAMVATLEQAARDGVPFCEECAKAALRAAA